MEDSFLTITKSSEAFFKEKSSKFYAYSYPVKEPEQVDTILGELRKKHQKAGHFCYAYFLGIDRQLFRANDDGEPSGTAGRPILGQLEKRMLTDTLVVVVRYFGGTKLGTSGLISAYKTSASLALDNAEIKEEIIKGLFAVHCNFEIIGPLMSIISGLSLNIEDEQYADNVKLVLSIRKSQVDFAIRKIKARLLDRPLDDIQEDTVVPNVNFDVIE